MYLVKIVLILDQNRATKEHCKYKIPPIDHLRNYRRECLESLSFPFSLDQEKRRTFSLLYTHRMNRMTSLNHSAEIQKDKNCKKTMRSLLTQAIQLLREGLENSFRKTWLSYGFYSPFKNISISLMLSRSLSIGG